MDEHTNFDLEEKFLKADRLISENKISEAAHLLEEILHEAPDLGKAHNHLGWLYETKFKITKGPRSTTDMRLNFHPSIPQRITIIAIVFPPYENMMSWKKS